MVTHREYRKLKRKQSRQLFSIQTNRKPLWIDRKTDRHARIIAVMFFVGIGLIYSFGFKTLATWSTISRVFFAFAVVTNFIPGKYLPLLYRIRKEMKVILSLFGLSPLFTAFILIINFSFVHNIKTESYNIEHVIHYHNDYLFKVKLENDELDKFIQQRTFSSDDFRFYPDSAHYLIGNGLFGFKVVRKSWLTE